MKDKRIWILSGIVLFAVAVVCVTVIAAKAVRQRNAEAEYEALAEQNNVSSDRADLLSEAEVGTSETLESPDSLTGEGSSDDSGTEAAESIDILEQMGIPIPEKEVDFAGLQENTNEDIYAWLYIPGTEIDYPILQHPLDNTYYLNRNLDGSAGYPGCIYTENYNAKDFSDANTVVYGHNMKNGTMFAGLHKYEDSRFFEENPYVYVYTEAGLFVYEIFAAYESSNEHILLSYNFENEVVFQHYLDDIYNVRSMNCNLNYDMVVGADNHIITLSTCIANKPDNRYLVQGVLLNED